MAGVDTGEVMIPNNYKILNAKFLRSEPPLIMSFLTMSFLIVAKKRANIKKGKSGMLPYAMQVSSEN